MTNPVSDNKPLILVVDDAPLNIRILVEALRQDYGVMVAVNGPDALALAESDPRPDLILLDRVMPVMDGHEVCRLLKNNDKTRDIPVIFITGDSSPDSEEKSFEVGAVDYVVKPFSLPVVRARVRTHVTLKHRTDMLERLAKLDGLTGIANRRRFDELLDMEWQRCARKQMPISVIIVDVDNFKLFNDTYGHGAGDKCLINLGQVLQNVAARPGDLAARYGGEEFALLLPFTPFEGAEIVAEKLRKAVSASRTHVAGESSTRRVTVSGGIATTVPKAEEGPARFLEAADDMLYKAKREGRNRVCGIMME